MPACPLAVPTQSALMGSLLPLSLRGMRARSRVSPGTPTAACWQPAGGDGSSVIQLERGDAAAQAGAAAGASCRWLRQPAAAGAHRLSQHPLPALLHPLAARSRDKTVWVWEAAPGDEYEVVDVKHGHSQVRRFPRAPPITWPLLRAGKWHAAAAAAAVAELAVTLPAAAPWCQLAAGREDCCLAPQRRDPGLCLLR